MNSVPEKVTNRRIIIVSNRLPISVVKKNNALEIAPSSGGLATGLASFHRDNNGLWIGWPGITPAGEHEKQTLEARLMGDFDCYPVYLSNLEIKKYYNGFSNNTLWPLFHYFPARCAYEATDWDYYRLVNHKFFERVMEVLQPDDIIWIHDYQLLLLPQLIREAVPDAAIGFFLHIPFPSMEVFRYLPWRNEILQGMLGADLIGFHTYDYSRHFLNCVLRLLGLEYNYNQIITGSRIITADTFPMGIDAARFSEAVDDPAVQSELENLESSLKPVRMILSVDRMDFTKGIPERLRAYEIFLEKYPEWHGKINYFMLCVPSRDKVQQYQLLKKEVDELVGRINGRFSNPEWTPILYMYRAVSFETLVSLYCAADLALVTPLRDGMNLVAKEYLACQSRVGKGILILSETAGAAAELGEAITVNPNNLVGIADAINEGLQMSDGDKSAAIQLMARRIQKYNVFRWGSYINEQLIKAKENQEQNRKFLVKGKLAAILQNSYLQTRKRLLLLDYDGTLVEFAKKPELAHPDPELLDTLVQLAADSNNKLVVISGRDRDFLSKWLGNTGVDLVAEHGTWIKEASRDEWELQAKGIISDWKEVVRPILEKFSERTPGSFVEEKSFALVWHYRKAEPESGSQKSKELVDALHGHISGTGLQVLLGNKVVEIKPADIHKGKGVLYYLDKGVEWDFILGMGDDYTDEDIFAILPENTWSIKVGFAPFTKARYYLESSAAARQLLKSFVEAGVVC